MEFYKHLIAVVDSNGRHRQQLLDLLLPFHAVTCYENYEEALEALPLAPPVLIILGDTPPLHASISFLHKLRNNNELGDIPIIHVFDNNDPGLINTAMRIGASQCLTKPYRRTLLLQMISSGISAGFEARWKNLPQVQFTALFGTARIFNHISIGIAKGEPVLFEKVKEACIPLVESVNQNQFRPLLQSVRYHNNHCYAHSFRVGILLSVLGVATGVKSNDQLLLTSGGLLHDIGKATIENKILDKPGNLDDAEYTIIQTHVPKTVGALMASTHIPKSVITIAEQHHEKIDGTGYPRGLRGRELNELARMAAIVDVFAALTDRHVYKSPMKAENALSIMSDEMSSHLDQHFISLFREVLLDTMTECPAFHQ